jgi:hypothetical protein
MKHIFLLLAAAAIVGAVAIQEHYIASHDADEFFGDLGSLAETHNIAAITRLSDSILRISTIKSTGNTTMHKWPSLFHHVEPVQAFTHAEYEWHADDDTSASDREHVHTAAEEMSPPSQLRHRYGEIVGHDVDLSPVSWGLDRIDDRVGLDGSFEQ